MSWNKVRNAQKSQTTNHAPQCKGALFAEANVVVEKVVEKIRVKSHR